MQAYALQKQLAKLGVTDEILDLKRQGRVYFRKFGSYRTLLSDAYNNAFNLLYVFKTLSRVNRFKSFAVHNINLTGRFNSFQEIAQNPPQADVYISGSDQTFNTHSGVNPYKFLKFGSEETKRISYASSMGKPEVEDRYLDEFIAAINRYRFLSVREACSAAYLSKLCNVPCSSNIDPTLLLSVEEWSHLAAGARPVCKEQQCKYILIYPILHNSLLGEAVRKLQKETGYKVIVINPYARKYVDGDRIIRDAGPLEFLNLYKNAAYVITTSFHGTCFSILFQKPFAALIRRTGEIRITNLLNLLDMQERIISDVNDLSIGPISFDRANDILAAERKKSVEYLVRALGL